MNFVRGHALIMRQLSAELVHEHGLTINDYEVLLYLSNAPERMMRRVDLAVSVLVTASGITRILQVIKPGQPFSIDDAKKLQRDVYSLRGAEDRKAFECWTAKDPSVEIQIVSFGQGRAKKGFMAMATVPAAKAALESAGIGLKDVKAIKTHNPFAVNDVYLARALDLKIDAFNNYGSSLVFGHPQGPTGMRLIIELIEELHIGGGGCGLFVGCAA